MKEEWKPVLGYEGLYEVSNCGKVKDLCKNMEPKLHDDGKGYFMTWLKKYGQSKTHKVHRMVAMAFIPNPSRKRYVNHIDGNKQNNCTDNLEWCTNKENVVHAFETGLIRTRKTVYSSDGNIFKSTVAAAEYYGTTHRRISDCCLGRQKTTRGVRLSYRPIVA